jgi:hypothetical protein
MGAYDFDLGILGGHGVVLLPPIGRESEMIRGSGKGTGRNLWARIGWVFFLLVLLFGLGVTSATAAPKAEAWTFWAANDPAGQVRVDHGPWGAKLLTIQGQKVSLDDIEHRILRPLWKDNRVHYAVNCASLGCPNLQPEAYTPENTEALLEKGAREYVNHSRGVRLSGDRLLLSSIYDWFQEDFGGTEESVSRNLQMYANSELAMRLKEFGGKFSYDYDWRINE